MYSTQVTLHCRIIDLGWLCFLPCVILCGCRQVEVPGKARESLEIVVEAPRAEFLPIHLEGRIDNRAPISHRPVKADMPVEWFRPEGEEVVKGEDLLLFDTSLQRQLIDRAQQSIEVESLELQLSKLRTEEKMSELQFRKAEFKLREKVLEKSIEASKKQDEEKVAIARLELEMAKHHLEETLKKLKRMKAMTSLGAISRRALREARDQYTKAKEAIRLPNYNLEVEQADTMALKRRQQQLELQKLRLDLGEEQQGEGVFGQIKIFKELQQMREQVQTDRLRRLLKYREENEAAIAGSVLKSAGTGTVSYQTGNDFKMGIGVKSRGSSIAFVLGREELVVRINLAERWRNLLQPWTPEEPEQGRVEVFVPALQARFRGRLLSISSTPVQTRFKSEKGFDCVVRLDGPSPALKVGMQALCEILVPLPAASVVLPRWLITNLRSPKVRLANGRMQQVEGILIGPKFVVTRGLEVGDRLSIPPTRRAPERTRVSGIVVPVKNASIKVERYYLYEIIDLVPDGSSVEKGQAIARLSAREEFMALDQLRLEASEITAASEYAIAKINAETELAKSYVAWKKATVDFTRARLNHLYERYVSYEEDRLKAEAAERNARVDLAALEKRVANLEDKELRATKSLNQIRNLELQLAKARLASAKSEVERASALRRRDWLKVWDAQEEMWEAQKEAEDQRTAFSIAREAHWVALHQAFNQFNNKLKMVERRQQELNQEEVLAPRSGRVYYRHSWYWGEPKVGQRVPTYVPFIIPIGRERKFEIEVPVHFYGRFHIGQTVQFHAPALRREPITGTIQQLSAGFMHSRESREEQLIQGTYGQPEKVFRMTVVFELTPEEKMKGASGIMAYMDL